MPKTPTNSETEKEVCAVVPLWGLRADWPRRFDLDSDVLVVRAPEEFVSAVRSRAEDESVDLASLLGEYGLARHCAWTLVMKPYVPTEKVERFKVINISLDDSSSQSQQSGPGETHEERKEVPYGLHHEVALLFLTALRLLGPHDAAVPHVCKAHVLFGDDTAEIGEEVLAFHGYSYDPKEHLFRPFKGKRLNYRNLKTLREVWPRLRELWDLCRIPADTPPQLVKSLDDPKDRRERREEIKYKTRLGRALALFELALTLPRLPAFVQLCMALEALYVTKVGDNSSQIRDRMSEILAPHYPCTQKDFSDCAKRVYKKRNDIVHGNSLAKEPPPEFKQAFTLVRLSLLTILKERRLFELFSDPRGERELQIFLRNFDNTT